MKRYNFDVSYKEYCHVDNGAFVTYAEAVANAAAQVRAAMEPKNARVSALEAMLGRIIKYATEDKAQTPGATRLARALDEACILLADGK